LDFQSLAPDQFGRGPDIRWYFNSLYAVCDWSRAYSGDDA